MSNLGEFPCGTLVCMFEPVGMCWEFSLIDRSEHWKEEVALLEQLTIDA